MTVSATTNPSAALATSAATANTSTNSSASSATSSSSSLVSQNTFLQLLVAQLKNQDPMNPDQQSGTQMVSELAQFSELEQVVGIGQNVQTITTDIGSQAAASGQTSSTGSGTDTSSTSTASVDPTTSQAAAAANSAAQLY